MSATHTPAPWILCEPNGRRMGWRAGPAWLGEVMSPTIAADARLIAAAPELLAALVSVAAYLNADNCDEWMIDEVRAAINKATGGRA